LVAVGDLNRAWVTREVRVPYTIEPAAPGLAGRGAISVSGSTKISRKDF